MRSAEQAAGGADLVMHGARRQAAGTSGRSARGAPLGAIAAHAAGRAADRRASTARRRRPARPRSTSACARRRLREGRDRDARAAAASSVNSASAMRSSRGGEHAAGRAAAPACRARRGRARRRSHSFTTPEALANSASTSSRMPLTTKKNGMKTPNATAVSFESNAGISRVLQDLPRDQARREPAEQQVEAEVGREQREREHEHDDPAHRELRALLERPLEQRDGPARRAHREHRDAHRQRDEGDQDQRVVQRALRREDQREQQDRPELPDRPGGEQVACRSSVRSSPRVREDGDQRADRGRRQRRPDVDERHDDAGGRQEPPSE